MSAVDVRRKGLMLVNPHARRGEEALDEIAARLAGGGLDLSIERFHSPDELHADILRRSGEADLAIVCGGDGTVNAAARAILQTGLPMGIIPMGTANDLARTLQIPFDLKRAADVIIRGHHRRIDVGTVNGHPFFNVASIGLAADLARGLTRTAKRRWGRLGYALAALRVAASARPFTATIVKGSDATRVKTYQVAVGNGRHYGGGAVIEANATIEDGQLDLYSLEVDTIWKLAFMLRDFQKGTHGAWEEVRTARGREFDVRTRIARSVNTDGDIVTSTPAKFRILPRAIAVYAPFP